MTSYSLKCKFFETLFKYRHIIEGVSIDNSRTWDYHVNFRSEYSFVIYFNDAVCSLVYITLSGRMINGHAFGREQL